ncbi:alpha/beta fold hydrolase [Virgibacillus sp. W0430]|uniref:alpha/beta fold hydrolase n=1 Tax=Virgibacillus sp. W0430 TaxID=3391580 RepID=UPI003F46BB46
MHDLKNGDLSIHYEWIESKKGTAKETIVFIHGIGLNMYSWDFVIPHFRKQYDIIRYDLRGHGKSDIGEEKLTIELLSKDLMYLLSELDIDCFHIVAQGLGGFIAVHIAAHIEEIILKTITLMTVPLYYPNELGEKLVQKRKALVAGEDSMIKLAYNMERSAYYNPTPEKLNFLYRSYKKVSPAVFFQLFHPKIGEGCLQLITRVRNPILLLSGAEDDIYPSELSNMSLNFVPNGRHYTVPKASFLVQFDQPKMMADMVIEFIKNNPKPNRTNHSITSYKKLLMQKMYNEYFNDRSVKKDQLDQQPVLTVNVMNGFDVEMNGEKIVQGWNKRKAKQLLIYLIIVKSATRDELCDVLWPDIHLENAKNRLRVSLHYIKRILNVEQNNASIIHTDREHVRLQVQVQCDLVEYMERLKSAHQLQNRAEKANMYGWLLEERTARPLPGLYEDWFLDFQSELEKDWADMAIFLADFFEEEGDYKKVLHYLQIALNYYVDDSTLTARYEANVNKDMFNKH